MASRRLAFLFWIGVATVTVAPVLAVTASTNRQVPRLQTVEGVLDRCHESLCVDDRPVDFGPRPQVGASAAHDFDGDGHVESMTDEMAGLVGSQVLLEVEPDGRDRRVRVVNGLTWLPLVRPPPWVEAPPMGPAAASPPARAVEVPSDGADASGRLLELDGSLTRCGDEWCVGETALQVGPWWYLNTSPAGQDFDGDGELEVWAAELEGLTGETVVVEIDRDLSLYRLNGSVWREPNQPPPWAGGPLSAPETPPTPPRPVDEDNDAEEEPVEEEQPEEDAGPPSTIPGPPQTIPGPPDTGPPDDVPADAGLPGAP